MVQFVQQVHDAPGAVRVKGTGGFIEDQHIGVHRKHTCHGHFFLLSAGEIVGRTPPELCQAHIHEGFVH